MEFLKYLVVSFIALVLDYGVYWTLANDVNVDARTAAVFGYAAGLILAYFLMQNNVFKKGWLGDKKAYEFFMFLVSGGLGMLLTYVTVWIASDKLGNGLASSKLMAVGTSFFGVYFFRKCIVFKERNETIANAKDVNIGRQL